MKLTAAHEPLGDIGRLQLGAFGRRMGGMFTVMKIREGLAANDYRDPDP